MLVYNTLAARHQKLQQSRRSLDGLGGKVVGFIDNSKPNFNYLADDLAELLVAKYGVASVVRRKKPGPMRSAPDNVFKELGEQCDVVVTGSGD